MPAGIIRQKIWLSVFKRFFSTDISFCVHNNSRLALGHDVITRVYHLRPIRRLIILSLDHLSISLAFFSDKRRENDTAKDIEEKTCEKIYFSSDFINSRVALLFDSCVVFVFQYYCTYKLFKI